ncbi:MULTISPECIES: protein kinase [unclassified Streptomyces]|uniref:phthiocerol/phthiodiolone dimycocerosyl transferase family protein n=1 Tax=unclassified Streptomyces TaxID=2593676 RepID=UPI001F04D908|nr:MULTISPECIES: protein kinase [unclassified Streptomyces]MCH0564670.1 protein kinase [Streptomyces sp. MUM 2J]MCH0570370.1 protein kinase [Streptomyces sp. MUM 136J]
MQRELCPVEGLYVAQRSRAVVSCALDGPVDTAALAAAFDNVTAERPTLLTRIVPAGTGYALALLPEGERPRLRARTGGDEEYAEELNDPLPVGGPLARATLVSAPGGERHLFVLVVDHVITDGHSAIALLNAVWDRYRECADPAGAGRPAAGLPAPEAATSLPAPVSTLLPPADPADVTRYLERRIEETGSPVELLAYDVPATGDTTGEQQRIEIQRLLLDAGQTGRLRRSARTAGLSVHGLVGAAVLIAARRRLDGTGPRVLRCMSPVDLRSRLTPALSPDVMVAAVTAHVRAVEVAGDSDPVALARQVGQGVRDFLDRGEHFHEMRIMPDVPRHPTLQLGTVIVTNMGVVPGPRLPDGLRMTDVRLVPAREHYFPQAGRSPLMACVVSFDGRLAVEFPHHTACFSPAFMAELRDEVRVTLLSLADEERPVPVPTA